MTKLSCKEVSEFRGEYEFLSNSYSSHFIDCKKHKWFSVDHYVQAHRSSDPSFIKRICLIKSLKDLYSVKYDDIEERKDWNVKRIVAVKKALRYKFWQNSNLRVLLLNTKDAMLINGNNENEFFWGRCKGKGQNVLGFLLMQLRHEYASMEKEGFDLHYPYFESNTSGILKRGFTKFSSFLEPSALHKK